jgi:hypothetical protein
MRPGAIKWIGAVVLLILGVRVTPWWRERSVTAASHRAIQAGRARQKDEAAREFYDYGVGCGEGDGAQVWPLLEALPRYPADLLSDLPAADVARRQTPLGQTLLFLCIQGCAQSESPLVRESRAKDRRMAEGYRLYHQLRDAPPPRQQECVGAFSSGYAIASQGARRNIPRSPAEAEQRRRRELEPYHHLTKRLLACTPNLDLEQTVVNYARGKIEDDWAHFYEIVAQLPRPIQLVFAMRQIRGEVDGDGFQHLVECDSWQFAPLATQGYLRVGAVKRAAVMKRAAAIIDPERAKAQHDFDLPKSEEAALDALDSQFYRLDQTEPVEVLIARHIRRHADQFLAD